MKFLNLSLPGKGGGAPPAPTPIPAPAPMPDIDAPVIQAAKKRKLAEVAARSGRASTILSEDTLGG